MITHLVVGRRIALLEQFANGLQTLDVLSAVRTNPAAFEELFVSTTKITSDAVKNQIRLKPGPSGCSNDETAVLDYIKKYIEESNEDGKYQVSFLYYFLPLCPSAV